MLVCAHVQLITKFIVSKARIFSYADLVISAFLLKLVSHQGLTAERQEPHEQTDGDGRLIKLHLSDLWNMKLSVVMRRNRSDIVMRGDETLHQRWPP